MEPEFESVDSFAQFLRDDERETFIPGEALKVAQATGKRMSDIIAQLKALGFKPTVPEKTREGRGYTSNNHDRYSEKNGWVGGCGIGNASRHMVQHYQPK